ncbi:nitroreductase family protein [Luteirhabdus pelagi]|uniref:nitroreductase family protein n=1 Tax=Luteirhabdus pelagi TaxID=2792783 RepID=UPI00193A24EA|nr:nitroreductase [Luteirhabdus pelagi]
MKIEEAIPQRRSVYPPQYSDKEITRETIETILEAANWAPTHRRTEPWRFKVFQGKAKQELAEFLREAYLKHENAPSTFKAKRVESKVQQAACVLAICMQRDPKESVPEWEEIAATSMAVQNLWLRARSIGIGGYWSTPFLKDHIGDYISLKEGETCLGFFYMGYVEEWPEGSRETSIADKTEFI